MASGASHSTTWAPILAARLGRGVAGPRPLHEAGRCRQIARRDAAGRAYLRLRLESGHGVPRRTE